MIFTDAEMAVWSKILFFEFGKDLGYTKPWEELDENERSWWLTSAKSAYLMIAIRHQGVTVDSKYVARLRQEALEGGAVPPEDSAQAKRGPLH